MHEYWLKPGGDPKQNDVDIWAVDFTAHPLLDPDFPQLRSRLLDLGRRDHERIRHDNEAYRQLLLRYFFPVAPHSREEISLASLSGLAHDYLQEADIYLASLIELLPRPCRRAVTPLGDVCACNDLRDLVDLSFDGADELVRYEARRKLFLALTLLQIDQSRGIQDGPRHLAYFEHILQDGLWCHKSQTHDLRIGYHVGENGRDINYTSRPSPADRQLDFHSTFLEADHGGRRISLDVLYHSCRFKRSVHGVGMETVDGVERVLEQPRWGQMRTASGGSILSKMIRKGINSPDEIADLIGAMFIVHDDEALDDLLLLLNDCLGTPFGWRNVTDTQAPLPSGTSLNYFSSKEFKVFKGDVDVLYCPDGGTTAPYRFPVEVQIFTLEGYLRTVCGTHEASHRALKQRQFLFGLVPRIFPRKVYGTEWLQFEASGGA